MNLGSRHLNLALIAWGLFWAAVVLFNLKAAYDWSFMAKNLAELAAGSGKAEFKSGIKYALEARDVAVNWAWLGAGLGIGIPAIAFVISRVRQAWS